MSRVNWDLTAGWLTRETIVSPSGAAGSSSPGQGSFDWHLTEARRTAGVATAAPPEPPQGSPPPRPPESPRRDRSQQSPRDDRPEPPRNEVRNADSRPAAEPPSESSPPRAADAAAEPDSPRDEPGTGETRDPEEDREQSSDAAAAETAAAQPQADAAHPQGSSPLGRNPKAAEMADHVRSHGKTAAPRSATKSRAEGSGNSAAKPSPATATPSNPVDAMQAATQAEGNGVQNAGDETAAATGDPDAAGRGKHTNTAAAPTDGIVNTVGGLAPAEAPTAATAAASAIEATAPTATDAASSPAEDAAQGQKNSGGARRAGQRLGPRASSEMQAATDSPQAAAGNDASIEATTPAESAAAAADLAAAKAEPKSAAANRSTDSPQDAKTTDPASARDVSSRTAETSGSRNEEAARSDAAERARFVQRVARAFESAAERAGHVRLRLHPPELGSLRLDLTVRDGHMSARLQTETESARNMLLENLPALKERLAEHHIKVESFDIEWQGQTQGGLSQRSGDQSRWQSPSPGYAPRASGESQSAAAVPAAAGPARRIGQGASLDVVI